MPDLTRIGQIRSARWDLESEDFGRLTKMVADVANQYCEGRMVSLLEGGYNVDALAESVACHLDTLVPAVTD